MNGSLHVMNEVEMLEVPHEMWRKEQKAQEEKNTGVELRSKCKYSHPTTSPEKDQRHSFTNTLPKALERIALYL